MNDEKKWYETDADNKQQTYKTPEEYIENSGCGAIVLLAIVVTLLLGAVTLFAR